MRSAFSILYSSFSILCDLRRVVPALFWLSYAGVGLPGRARTCGLPLRRRALCRLSYWELVGRAGLEPASGSLKESCPWPLDERPELVEPPGSAPGSRRCGSPDEAKPLRRIFLIRPCPHLAPRAAPRSCTVTRQAQVMRAQLPRPVTAARGAVGDVLQHWVGKVPLAGAARFARTPDGFGDRRAAVTPGPRGRRENSE
jgi:hypothetical protein